MSERTDRVAFLCLGTMGYPMAGHLKRAGYDYERARPLFDRRAAEAGPIPPV